MSEIVSELKVLEEGLEVRISMLREDVAKYFLKDVERLRRLIEKLKRTTSDD